MSETDYFKAIPDVIDVDIISVRDIKEYIGKTIRFEATIQNAYVTITSNGDTRLVVTWSNNGLQRDCQAFKVPTDAAASYKVGKVYRLSAFVKESPRSGDGYSLVLKGGEETEKNPLDILKWQDGAKEAIQGIYDYLKMVQHSDIGKLTYAIFKDQWDAFIYHPAAQQMHHKFMGGLAVHTYSVASVCLELADFYNRFNVRHDGTKGAKSDGDYINTNLLLCGALLHDIGKLREFNVDPTTGRVTYSEESILSTHICTGVDMITEKAIELGMSDRREVLELKHLVLSHHGKKEYGSPIEPNCVEAIILHAADVTDADVNKHGELNAKQDAGTGKTSGTGSFRVNNYKATQDRQDLDI